MSLRSLTVRKGAAIGVAAVGIELVLSAAKPDERQLVFHPAPGALASAAYLLVLLVGIVLISVAPRMWAGTRAAVRVATGLLCVMAILSLIRGPEYSAAALEVILAAALVAARRAFPLGSSNRPRPWLVAAGIGSWILAYVAVVMGPVTSEQHHAIRRALHHALRQAFNASIMSAWWIALIEVLIGAALVVSVLMVRSVLAPAAGGHGHDERQNRAARAIIWQHGQDSLSPFLLRPDKALHFDFDGVLSYRVIGGTAVVSGDPVGPPGAAPRVLSSFLDLARERGWKVAVWGASWRHLSAYRGLGLRALQAGEEAFVDPRSFTLQGRRVRKLRQSVHRLTRRGWQLQTYEGRALAPDVEAEVDAVERSWRAGRTHLIGFAMGMGAFDPDVRPDDLYLLARSPEGDLRGVMRFAAHCGRLSLDTMRRVGETPNGLNEAMVCRALEWAGERGIDEVSLNYAGLAHLARAGRTRRLLSSAILSVLGSRFQLERLVRFNQKFSPTWRPRFLIYQSRVGLPLTLLRVLQAEGYLPAPGSPARLRPRDRKRSPAGSAPARAAG